MQHSRAGKIVLKAQKNIHLRTPEAINGLVGIADSAKVGLLRAQGFNESILGRIDILVLIYGDMAEPAANRLPGLGRSGKQLHRF